MMIGERVAHMMLGREGASEAPSPHWNWPQDKGMIFIAASPPIAFVIACILVEITPGPNMGYLAVLSAARGRRAGYAAVVGIVLGLFGFGLAAALGVAAVITTSPMIYQVMRWAGIGYLLWLAWGGWAEADDPIREQGATDEMNWKYFRRGLVTNLLNPKAGLFYVAVLPSFVDPAQPILGQTLLLSGIFVLVATTIHTLVVTLAGLATTFLSDLRRALVTRRILSLALAGVAIWFAWSTRT